MIWYPLGETNGAFLRFFSFNTSFCDDTRIVLDCCLSTPLEMITTSYLPLVLYVCSIATYSITYLVDHPNVIPSHTYMYMQHVCYIKEQDTIGWHHLLKGHLSKQWSTAQQACYAQRTDLDKRKFTILRWRRRLIKSIIEGCITCWETRNQALHGET